MQRCPRCGRYMENHMVQKFGGAKLVYNCVCGYSSEEQDSGMYWSDTSVASPAGRMWDSVSHLPSGSSRTSAVPNIGEFPFGTENRDSL